ncbi:MAG: hypothetical protein ABIR71_00810 [Chthoniobacterales bacterium]
MKTQSIVLPLLALGAAALVSSCTTAQPTASIPPNDPRQGASIDNRRSYSQEELQKRGGPQLSDSLAAQDASVRISGGAR